MHKYFILLLVILIILIIIFTVIVYNELVTLRNAVTSSWKDLTKLIDEYMKLSGNDTDECDRRIFMGMSLRREDKTGIDRSVFGEI